MTSETTPSTTLLVLAAGLGSRYGGLKQLEQLGPSGETLMDYSIYDAQQAGFSRVVFLIREEMREQFEEQVGSKYEGILEVDYAYQDKNDLPSGFDCPSERERPWGTGHAVWAARESLKFGPFAVINADDYYGSATFSELIRTFDRTDSDEGELACSMVGFRLRETLSTHGTVSRGICVVRDDYLNTVEEWTKIGNSPLSGIDSSGKNGELTGEEIVSMNVWAFPPTVFPLLEQEFVRFLKEYPDSLTDEFYLPAAVDSWISGNLAKVSVRSASCKWMGVTYKDDKPAVIEALAKLVEDGHYPTPLFASNLSTA